MNKTRDKLEDTKKVLEEKINNQRMTIAELNLFEREAETDYTKELLRNLKFEVDDRCKQYRKALKHINEELAELLG